MPPADSVLPCPAFRAPVELVEGNNILDAQTLKMLSWATGSTGRRRLRSPGGCRGFFRWQPRDQVRSGVFHGMRLDPRGTNEDQDFASAVCDAVRVGGMEGPGCPPLVICVGFDKATHDLAEGRTKVGRTRAQNFGFHVNLWVVTGAPAMLMMPMPAPSRSSAVVISTILPSSTSSV